MGADPVRQTLGPGGLGIGVVGGAEHRDEDLRLADLAGVSVDNRHGLAGIIHKQLLAGPVVLAHDHIQLALPGAVVLAEPAVLVAVGVAFPVLLPEQEQGDPLALRLPVDRGPVRQAARLCRQRRGAREQQALQRAIIQIGGQRPGQPGFLGPAQVLIDRRARDAAAPGGLAIAQAMAPTQA